MDSLLDMGQKIFELYKKALEKYPYIESEDNSNNNNSIEEEQNETERLNYVLEEISYMPDEILDNFISLLAVYYYTKFEETEEENELYEEYDDDEDEYEYDNDEDEYDNKIFKDIETQTKEEFIYDTKQENNEHLTTMVSDFIEEEITSLYDLDMLEEIEYDNYDVLNLFEEVEYNEIEKIITKFHPNPTKELKNYKDIINIEKYIEKATKIKINSTGQFIQLYEVVRKNVNNKDFLKTFLLKVLDMIEQENNKTFREIIVLILRYYYIKNYLKKQNDIEETKLDIYFAIKEIDDFSRYSNIIEEFIDFNFQKFYENFDKIPQDIKDTLQECITLENLNTYGTEGLWTEYSSKKEYLEQEKNIIKYCPTWFIPDWQKNKNNEDKYIIYYTKDKNNNFNIPRILLTIDKNNNIIKIDGKDQNSCIEYELLDILENKVLEYPNIKNILNTINILKIYSSINKKINNNEELNNTETEILFNIKTKKDNIFFNHFDYRIEEMKEKANKKKILAKYYNCKEEQIALKEEELNKETVVLMNSLDSSCTKLNLPKLKIIFGNIYCDRIENGEELKSLEQIKGLASFASLKSSKGLENLIYIGDNLYLNSIEDYNYFNPNLNVEGDIFLPNNVVKKRKKEI